MKKKTALIFGLILLVILSWGSGVVIGQTSSELPRMEVACESRDGSVRGFNDGFSILKKCPKGFRKISLGQTLATSSGNTTTGNLNAGNISFVSFNGDRNLVYVLDKNGKAWFIQINEMELFERNSNFDLPTSVSIDNVVGWNYGSFVLKTGEVYLNTGENGWVMTGFKSE